uniref:Uncharacterized protein n=1 Tax=Oryza glumipatula TaxID=40148 RepID=A0A0E0BIG5_9ORYZ
MCMEKSNSSLHISVQEYFFLCIYKIVPLYVYGQKNTGPVTRSISMSVSFRWSSIKSSEGMNYCPISKYEQQYSLN